MPTDDTRPDRLLVLFERVTQEWQDRPAHDYRVLSVFLAEHPDVRALASEAVTEGLDVEQDARRYRRLRVLGAAPYGSRQLDNATVLRFTGLDEFVDENLASEPTRGEAEYARLSGGTDRPDRLREALTDAYCTGFRQAASFSDDKSSTEMMARAREYLRAALSEPETLPDPREVGRALRDVITPLEPET